MYRVLPGKTVTILICGDRNYIDVETITSVLTMCQQKYGSITIIHGGCSGADTISGAYATCNKLPCKSFPAQWKQYGRGAGPIRNKQMIEEGNPSLVIAFHPDIKSSKGTKDMVSQAMKKNIPVMLVSGKSDSIQVLSMDMLT